jgi:hypothetical protein
VFGRLLTLLLVVGILAGRMIPDAPPTEAQSQCTRWLAIGSTRQEVYEVLGPPRRVDDYGVLEVWGYGQWSTITFRNGVVVGWNQSDVDLRLGAGPNGSFVADGERNAAAVARYIYRGVSYPTQVEQDIYSVMVVRVDSSRTRPVAPVVRPEQVARVWPVGIPDYIRRFEYRPTYPACAENGSCYGDISPLTGRPKTVYVHGYFRRDGTYVRSHYRSTPRR